MPELWLLLLNYLRYEKVYFFIFFKLHKVLPFPKIEIHTGPNDKHYLGYVPFSVSETSMSHTQTLFHLDGTEPLLVSSETPVLTQPFLLKVAAVKNVLGQFKKHVYVFWSAVS